MNKKYLIGVFNDTSPLIILAIGQMIVILTRCIDLSVAANLALCGMVSAMLNGAGVPLPLISYGGTSMVMLCLSLGILMSIATHKNVVAT
jgi:ribose/xylose/arabinose/galactoside ABC-type transport system permease subunit